MNTVERARRTDALLAKGEVFRCAVEWFDAGMEMIAQEKSGKPLNHKRAYNAVNALALAVERWKEAQA